MGYCKRKAMASGYSRIYPRLVLAERMTGRLAHDLEVCQPMMQPRFTIDRNSNAHAYRRPPH
jgi:hypothetical protein